MRKYVSLFLILAAFILPAQSWSTIGGPPAVKVELLQEEQTVQPGRPFWVALALHIDDGWHVYWKNPGDIGMPLKVDWQLPAGYQACPLQWPFPEKFITADMVGFGYKGDVMLLSLITPPQNLELNKPQQLTAKVRWLVCSSLMCQPGADSAKLTLNIKKKSPSFAMKRPHFSEARSKLPTSKIKIITKRKDGLVQLECLPQRINYQKMSWELISCRTEEQDIIDHSVDPTVAMSSDESNSY